jgi:glutathione S-transferase
MNRSYTLYSMQNSGNCYKPRLLMHRLGLPFRLIDTDSLTGETRSPAYLALNPNGKVPLLILPDGRALAESNAMLLHLAEDTAYLPADAYERALCYQWLFFEQYSHEPYVAVARSWLSLIPGGRAKAADRIAEWHKRGYAAFDVMEQRLRRHDWLVGASLTIADIALFAYSHVAEEGDFDLAAYPGVRSWIARLAARPGHVGLEWRP